MPALRQSNAKRPKTLHELKSQEPARLRRLGARVGSATCRHTDLSPWAPLHAHSRPADEAPVASDRIEGAIGCAIVGLPTATQHRCHRREEHARVHLRRDQQAVQAGRATNLGGV